MNWVSIIARPQATVNCNGEKVPLPAVLRPVVKQITLAQNAPRVECH